MCTITQHNTNIDLAIPISKQEVLSSPVLPMAAAGLLCWSAGME